MNTARKLKLLSTLHYVYGALICVSGLGLLALVFLGTMLQSDWLAEQGGNPPPAWVGGLVGTIGWVLFVLVELVGIMNMLSGNWIASRKNRTGSMIVAGLDCLNIPFGIALGIFTFISLNQDEAVALYEQR
ncbi:MAG: hypothetical protein KDB88_01100 [Flavobacteriales bacterium]|nr:hypothetical protein [Flavobacteriales bacterium]